MTEQIYTFKLPDIGEGVVEGEVIEWLKKVGDEVKKDEPVVIVMTDKATVELPAPYPGVIIKQYYQPGEISIKDKPLYDLRLMSGIVQTQTPQDVPSEILVSKKALSPQPKINKKASLCEKRPGKALAIPKVRHLAKEFGVDLESLTGSGNEGRVTLDDLKQVENKVAPSSLPITRLDGDEEQPLIGIRGLMARKMDGFRIPQFSYFEQVEVTRLIQLRDNSKEKAAEEGKHLSFMPFFIRTLALVVKQHPQLNSSIDMQTNMLVIHKQLNVGMAMATPQGLIVPVLKGVEEMGIKEIVENFENLKAKAQTNKLLANDMKEATITLSNYGVLGEGKWATPMISHPEVAILAVGRIVKAPVVKNNEVVVRDVLSLSWSFDHRVIDGELAAKISHDFCTLLRDPASLL